MRFYRTIKDHKKTAEKVYAEGSTRTLSLLGFRRLGISEYGLSALFLNAAAYPGQPPYVHTPDRPSWGVLKGTQ